MPPADILEKIIDRKRLDVEQRRSKIPLDELIASIGHICDQADGALRGFHSALEKRISQHKPAIIAEIKKASPSKGLIRQQFDVEAIAVSYEKHGASCLSVLTEEHFFKGHDDFLLTARKSTNLPVIRKDFILDPYQLYESRVLKADCVLLIVSALEEDSLDHLYHLALDLGMDVLLEVHDEAELKLANKLSPKLLGINNRNLHTFETSLQNTLKLLADVPDDCLVVTESGIHSREDVDLMISNGVFGFLVGEVFMRAHEPGVKLREIFF